MCRRATAPRMVIPIDRSKTRTRCEALWSPKWFYSTAEFASAVLIRMRQVDERRGTRRKTNNVPGGDPSRKFSPRAYNIIYRYRCVIPAESLSLSLSLSITLFHYLRTRTRMYYRDVYNIIIILLYIIRSH